MNRQATADKKLIKKMNTNAILNIIRQNEPISRADIAKILNLNPATVSNNVGDLLKKDLIKVKGNGASKGGRRPILLAMNNNRVFVIGVHTELTHINVGLVTINGKVVEQVSYRFGQPVLADYVSQQIDTILYGIRQCLTKAKAKNKSVIGIGLALHGLVNPEKGESIYAPAFDWHHVRIRDIIHKKFNLETFIENDVRAMALGEKWFGKAKTSENFMLINIGEGVGGALIVNGKLYYGSAFGAGEIGHIQVTKRNSQSNGTLTKVASEEGIVERTKLSLAENHDMDECFNGDIAFKTIVKRAQEDDPVAHNILKETGKYIGRAVGVIINLINPEQVLLTGTVLLAKEFLMESIIQAAQQNSLKDNFYSTKITSVSNLENLGIIGAATLVINHIFSIHSTDMQ